MGKATQVCRRPAACQHWLACCLRNMQQQHAPPVNVNSLRVRFRLAVSLRWGMGNPRLAAPPPPYAWQEVVMQVLKIKGERVGCTLAKRHPPRPPFCTACRLDGLALCAWLPPPPDTTIRMSIPTERRDAGGFLRQTSDIVSPDTLASRCFVCNELGEAGVHLSPPSDTLRSGIPGC